MAASDDFDAIDPFPDVHALFLLYNRLYFDESLGACSVEWSSNRMTLCAGICQYERGGGCRIKLSEPLLKYRPSIELKETLLHEMIHAWIFLGKIRDQGDHGPRFQERMNFINRASFADHQRPPQGYSITVYHSMHAEVDQYRTHHWQCPKCGNVVKRAMNRPPQEADCRGRQGKGPDCKDTKCAYHMHQRFCGGDYTKIAEPEGLRASLLGVRLRKPWRYQVALQVHTTAARTEVSDVSSTPDFVNRVFVLHLPSGGSSNKSLDIQIHAKPGKDFKPATSTHGDSDSSTLVAQASVQLAGALLDRLARGDRVPVTLELQPLADIPSAPRTRERDLEDKQEITLELMLVGSSAEPKPQQQLTDGGTLGKGPGAAGSSCELLCHIARATQLPAINRFVAALLMGQLQLALQNEADGTILARCSIPLRDLQLRRNYNLQLAWDAAQYLAEQLRDADLAVSAETMVDVSLVNSPSYTAHVVAVLTDDLIAKQSALDKLQRAVLRAEGTSQLGLWRVQEVEKRNGTLAADLSQLRKLLHQEKTSSKAALSVNGWERLPRDEIVTRACQAVAAVAHEKSRNAELVYRLQQTHEEGIEAKQLKSRFAELQEAHVTQGRLVRKLEAQICDSEQTLNTVKSQEKVIAKLENLLKQATQERRAALATAAKLQQQLEALDSRLETSTAQIGVLQEDNARLKAFNKYEEIERVQKMAAEETETVRRLLTAEADAARTKAAADVEIVRDSAASDAEAIRQKAAADVDAIRTQEQLEDARSREDNARDNAEEFESERLSASMRAEKAEASAIAAQHELIDVTKRYAREIAMLKTRLAEKDAQLMGGFGALSNMQLGGSQGWLGVLHDPDSIAASLPDQPHPYIHTQHPLPRQTAWGVLGSQASAHVSTTNRSGGLGPLGVPQQPSHVRKSAAPRCDLRA
ncbi:hypothetical protein WJX79_002030 [Trebouxia sp. C0005]